MQNTSSIKFNDLQTEIRVFRDIFIPQFILRERSIADELVGTKSFFCTTSLCIQFDVWSCARHLNIAIEISNEYY